MSKKRILFVIPRNKSLFGDKTTVAGHPHIGVAYLSAFLKQNNIEIAIYDDGVDFDHAQMLDQIKSFQPDIIGITIFSYCFEFAKELIGKIRSATKIPIIAGGPHVSAVKRGIFEQLDVDFSVKGEGEHTLLEFLDEINKPKPDYSTIAGLIWKDTGNPVENADRPPIMNLDELPFPDQDSFPMQRYSSNISKVYPLITSRGCPFGCNYCSVRLSMGQRFRARSAQNVFDEIQFLTTRGFQEFAINDDCFTLDKQRAEDICDLIIEHKLAIRFQLFNGIRVDTVTPRLLKKMKAAGCFFLSYGCEAGTEKVLKAIRKGIHLQQVRDAVRWTNEAKIHNSVNFIIGHTQETYQDALETIRFAESLPTDFVNFYNLLPYPGTESFEWIQSHGRFLIPPEEFLRTVSYRDNSPVFETPEFSAEQRSEVTRRGFNLYRKRILTYRLGKGLGTCMYLATSCEPINKLATNFALGTNIGKRIYGALSKRSVS